MIYDIFISYRRQGGHETAKHLFDLLSRDNYTVSFDIDTLRSGDFDTELLKRIDECTDFILILNQGALDRSLDLRFKRENDWLRNELAYALEKNKNIIPIMLNGFTGFPDNLPDDIVKVVRKNGPKYDQYYFDEFYNRLVSRFLESRPREIRPKQQTTPSIPVEGAILRIKPDMDCRVFRFGEELIVAKANQYNIIHLRKGKHVLEFVSLTDSRDRVELTHVIEDNDMEDLLEVKLRPYTEKREWQEQGYTGETRDGKRHGYGTMIMEDARYEGEWRDDKITGKGIYYWNTGNRYEGEFVNGKYSGHGVFYWENGPRYEGEWVDDKRSGKGRFYWPNGDQFEGEWKDDRRNGVGVYQWANGDRYEGEWQDDLRMGKGTMFWIEGSRYEGEWFNNHRSGHGVFYWSTGSRYEGEWKNDLRSGYGILFLANGDQYAGEWHNDCKHGKGVYKWNDGNRYEGQWENDFRSGSGIYYWANGERYEGQWKNDKMTGKGSYYWTNGNWYEGQWKDDQKVESGYYHHDGKVDKQYYN